MTDAIKCLNEAIKISPEDYYHAHHSKNSRHIIDWEEI